MLTPRRLTLAAILATACGGLVLAGPLPPAQTPRPAVQAATPTLPASLTNAQFWKLSVDLSEAGGTFRSENLVSNEHTHQYVIPDLLNVAKPGRVYMGAGPEQNFTYIAALKPAMASS